MSSGYRRAPGGGIAQTDSDDESTNLDHRDAVGTDAFRKHYGGGKTKHVSPPKSQQQQQQQQQPSYRTPTKQKAPQQQREQVQSPSSYDDEGEDDYYQQPGIRGGGGSGHVYGQQPPQQQQPSARGGDSIDQVQLEALQEEVSRLRDALSATSQGTAEASYLQQLKKARDLTVKLESERSKVTKLQNQMVSLEREKMMMEQQEKKGVLLPSQRSPTKTGGAGTTHAADDAEILAKEVADTKERLDRSGRLVASLRKQNEDLKRDLFKMKKVLSTEIGDAEIVERAIATIQALQQDPPGDENASVLNGNASTIAMSATTAKSTTAGSVSPMSVAGSVGGGTNMATANNKEPGWRGRAQQITILKSKVKDLERFKEQAMSQAGGGASSPRDGGGCYGDDTATVRSGTTTQIRDGPLGGGGTRSVAGSVRTNATGRTDFDDVNRVNVERTENKKKQEVRELKMSIDEKAKEVDKEKTRADSLTARLQILERDNQHLKVCMAKILEKTDNDDKLIAEYQEKIGALQEEVRVANESASNNNGYRVVHAQPQQKQQQQQQQHPPQKAQQRSGSVAFDAAAQQEVASLKVNLAHLQQQLAEEKQQRLVLQQQQQQKQSSTTTGGRSGGGGYNPHHDDSDDDIPHGGAHGGANQNAAAVGDAELQQLLDLAEADPEASLSKAIDIIDLQRCTLLAFNEQLQEGKEKMTSSYLAQTMERGGESMAKHTREENIYLKERLRDLTKLMDQEVTLHKQIATQGGLAPSSASTSRSDSQVNTRRPSTNPGSGSQISSARGRAPPQEVQQQVPMFEKREYAPSHDGSQGGGGGSQVGGSARRPGGGVPMPPRQLSSASASIPQASSSSATTSSNVVKLPAVAGRRKSRPESQGSMDGDTPPASRGSMMGMNDDGMEDDGRGGLAPSQAMQQEAIQMKQQYAELQKKKSQSNNGVGVASSNNNNKSSVKANGGANSRTGSGRTTNSRTRTPLSQVS